MRILQVLEEADELTMNPFVKVAASSMVDVVWDVAAGAVLVICKVLVAEQNPLQHCNRNYLKQQLGEDRQLCFLGHHFWALCEMFLMRTDE